MAVTDNNRNLKMWLAAKLLKHQILLALFTILVLFAAQQAIFSWMFPENQGPQLNAQVVYASTNSGR